MFFDEVTEKNKLFDKNKSERQNKLSESCLVLNESIKNVKDKIESIRARLVDFNRQILELGYEKNGINQCVEALKLQKPCLFSSKKIKVEFREKKKKYSDQLQAVIGKEIKIKNQISEY